jgi:flagellar motor switch protein FliM
MLLINRIVVQLLGFLQEPWQNVMEIRPKLEKIETNPQFAMVIPPNDMVALIPLTIKIGKMEGLMSFCIPFLTLEAVIDKLSAQAWFASMRDDEDINFKDDLSDSLEKTNVNVAAVVGRANISITDFIHLQKGDIIPLDRLMTSDLDIMVGDVLKFRGKPGKSRGRNAIQITSLVGKEE